MNTYNRVKGALIGRKEKGISTGNGGCANDTVQSSVGEEVPDVWGGAEPGHVVRWAAGHVQNWTSSFKQWEHSRGFSLVPWLARLNFRRKSNACDGKNMKTRLRARSTYWRLNLCLYLHILILIYIQWTFTSARQMMKKEMIHDTFEI